MWSNVAGKWPGSLGLFGLLQIHDKFEHAKLRSRSRDGDEFFGGANFIQFNEEMVGKNEEKDKIIIKY